MEGENTFSVDTTAIVDMASGVKDSILDFVTAILPIVGGIAAAVLVFWLGKMVFRLIKQWMNAGK